MRLGLGIGVPLLIAQLVSSGGGGDTPVAGTLTFAGACSGSLTGLVGAEGVYNINCQSSASLTGTLGFDPAAMPLGMWQRAGNYDASTGNWTGQASAGSSGSRSLVQATASFRPIAGTALNGHVPPDYDGSNDVLASSGFFITDLVSGGAGSVAVLFNADTAAAAQASPNFQNDEAIFADAAGRFGISITATGARAWIYNGTTRVATPLVACTLTAWHWAFAWYDGTTLYFQLDNNAPVTVAKGGATTFAASQAARIGANVSGFFDGRVAECMVQATAFTTDEILNILRYGSFRYAVPASPP